MCGILGERNLRQPLERDQFEGLLALSKHRGPDASEVWQDGHVNFGFNRLSILDTSIRGMQPIVSPTGRYVVVLNGEIYNYKDLQHKFGIPDEKLRSGSDVEVVAQLVDIVDKIELIGLLNGMFALAVYDRNTTDIYISRDFAGIKPLFYGVHDGTFVFASQFDQLFKHPSFGQNLKISGTGIRDYLEFGYMQAPNTVFENIYQVNPGEMVIVDRNLKISTRQIVSFPSRNVNTNYEYNETNSDTVTSFLEVFKQVIKDQLVSDVPIGTFLSGGIDSPLVTAIAGQAKEDLTAFSFGTEDKESNELEKAREYAEYIHVKLASETLKAEDIIRLNDEHFKAYSEPFGDASSLPTYIITKLAKRHLTVLLSGDGGDELFWGYPRFASIVENAHYFKYSPGYRRGLASVKRFLGKKTVSGLTEFEGVGEWQRYKHAHLGRTIDRAFGTQPHNAEIDRLYNYDGNLTDKQEMLNWLRWNEYYAHMQRVLIKVDRASMYNSMEVRVPFLDKRVIEFAWKIKPELGITHTNPKFILKKAMEVYYPVSIINKEKKGFSIPFKTLTTALKAEIEMLVLEKDLFGSAFYDQEVIRQEVRAYFDGNGRDGWGIWIVYAMQKWADKNGLLN